MFQRPPADGALIRETNYPFVWIVRNGQKCHVLSPQVFAALNVTAADIEILTWDDINRLPNGPDEDGHLGRVPLPPAVTALGWHTPYLHCYSHDYFQGSQHIESWTRLWPDGTVEGVFRYHNDSLWGFCGGVGVSICDKYNFQIHACTPPSGCISGKPGGQEVSRDVGWGDNIPSSLVQQTARLLAKAYPTQGQSILNAQQVAQLIGVVVKAIGGNGGGGNANFLESLARATSNPGIILQPAELAQLIQVASSSSRRE